jgi:hypothetical protein
LKGQTPESGITKDTIRLKEIMIQNAKHSPVSGALSGKITLDVEGLKPLPSMLGTTNVLKLLELTPGVQTSGDGNSNLYVRGGDPGQNLLLYNDNPIYSPGHILNIFPLFNPGHISSVQLSKSGFNSSYGGMLSSVIAVDTKNEIPRETSVSGNLGLLGFQASSEFSLGKNWGAYVSARRTYLELLLKPITNLVVEGSNDADDLDYNFWDGNITLVGKLSDKNKLIFDLFMSSDKLDIKDEDIILNGYLKWSNTILSTKLETTLSDNKKLEQQVSFSSFKNKLHTSQAEMYIEMLSEVQDVGYKNKLSVSLDNIKIEGGLQYTYHSVLPQETETYNSEIIFDVENVGRNEAHDLAAFVSSELRIVPRLFIEPGLRYNFYSSKINRKNQRKNFQNIDYRFSSRYQLSGSQFLRAGFSYNTQYMTKLTPSSIGLPTDFWISASKDILPQKGQEYSLGYYQSVDNNKYEISTDIYYRKMKNVSEFNQNFMNVSQNVFTEDILYGKGRSYGFEIMVKKNTGRVTGWISYSWGKSDRNFEGIENGRTFPAKYDRRHDFSATAMYAFNKRWDISMAQIYATGNTYTLPTSWYFMNGMPVKEYGKYNNALMPDYIRTDVSVNYWFKKDNGLNFSIYNMFMVKNPIYVFITLDNKPSGGSDEERFSVKVKKKTFFPFVPSFSWNFKF